MDYKEFFDKFGASARTDYLPYRPFKLPEQSGLPKEFIRLSPWELESVYSVARGCSRGIIEAGRYLGGSVFMLACAAPAIPIVSIDISPQDDEQLKRYFAQHKVGQNVQLIVGDSNTIKSPIPEVDMLFIDGDHSYNGCMGDIRNFYDNVVVGGHLVFHDAHIWPRHGVRQSILDFMKEHPELQPVLPVLDTRNFWEVPTGSICHLIKRG